MTELNSDKSSSILGEMDELLNLSVECFPFHCIFRLTCYTRNIRIPLTLNFADLRRYGGLASIETIERTGKDY